LAIHDDTTFNPPRTGPRAEVGRPERMPPRVFHHVQPQGVATLGATGADQARLLESLVRPAVFGPRCTRVERLETHISYVLLTGEHAYKIKKAVNFGFLDFTTLAARRFFCAEELRLNRRLAPDLYLDVVPISGSVDAPVLGGDGPALEYAVKMREFRQEALASRILARGELSPADIDALAARVAAFHGTIAVAAAEGDFGAPEELLRVTRQNFAQMRPLLAAVEEDDEIDALCAWTEREHAARRGAFLRRRRDGFVRECHGDLHLGNIARIDGELVIFDCIEFNAAMRWIDVMSEVAFTVMDLENRRRADLSYRFLNAYLEQTGDYAGLGVLRFYLVYRALVRAKVARLRAQQLDAGAASALHVEYRGYVSLARRYARAPRPALILAHGFSGCGKTTLSQPLLESIGAVRIRSDVERKRLHGLDARTRQGGGVDRGLYTPAVTRATYQRLATLAREVVSTGGVAIVDATFLRRWQRDLFYDVATELAIPLVIVDFVAQESTLRTRIAQRAATGADASDADLAVLGHQLRTCEPLAGEEQGWVLAYDAEAPLERAHQPDAWRALLERIDFARPFQPSHCT
jgi:uncharacterized protein